MQLQVLFLIIISLFCEAHFKFHTKRQIKLVLNIFLFFLISTHPVFVLFFCLSSSSVIQPTFIQDVETKHNPLLHPLHFLTNSHTHTASSTHGKLRQSQHSVHLKLTRLHGFAFICICFDYNPLTLQSSKLLSRSPPPHLLCNFMPLLHPPNPFPTTMSMKSHLWPEEGRRKGRRGNGILLFVKGLGDQKT